MDGTEAEVGFVGGFEEFDEEAEEHVGEHEEAEAGAVLEGDFSDGEEGEEEGEGEGGFVELGGVARAVAEVDGPGEGGVVAVGVVGESGEEAADASDGDGGAEGEDPGVAGALVEVEDFFGDFCGEPGAGESADDGFSSGEEVVHAWSGRAFDPSEEFGADERSDRGGGSQPKCLLDGFVCGEFAAVIAGEEHGGDADEIAEAFHDGVGVDGVSEEVEIDRELHDANSKRGGPCSIGECEVLKAGVLTGVGRMGYSFDLAGEAAILGDGVTVAQQFLVLLVQVRILIPQVFLTLF